MKSKRINLSNSHSKPASSGGCREPLSFRTLTTLKGYENLKEDEAIAVFDSISQLALLLYELVKNKGESNSFCIDNQLDVNSHDENLDNTKIVSLPQDTKQNAA